MATRILRRSLRWVPRLLVLALVAAGLAVGAHGVTPAATRAAGAAVDPSAHPAAADDVRTVRLTTGRTYLLLADADTAPEPLVVLLHGTGVGSRDEMRITGFEQVARTQHVLLVAPVSVGPSWNSGSGCCKVAAQQHVDDLGYVRDVLSDVRQHHRVDPHRIYLVGYSNGGKLAYGVACRLPGVFAATATYGSGPQWECHDSAPQSAFVGYGTADAVEPPGGMPPGERGVHQPAATTVAQLVARDGCGGSTVRTVASATVRTWSGCRGGSAVAYATWAGHDHLFPVTPAVAADATGVALMWPFLAGQRLGQ